MDWPSFLLGVVAGVVLWIAVQSGIAWFFGGTD